MPVVRDRVAESRYLGDVALLLLLGMEMRTSSAQYEDELVNPGAGSARHDQEQCTRNLTSRQQRVGGVGKGQLSSGVVALVSSDRVGRLIDDVHPLAVGVDGHMARVRVAGSGQVLDLLDGARLAVVRVYPDGVAHVVGRVEEVIVGAQSRSVNSSGAVIGGVGERCDQRSRVVD